MNKKYLLFIPLLIIFFSLLVLAGTIIPSSSTPEPTMYSLIDIYNLIHNNTFAVEHGLSPSVEPISTSSYSISQIYADLANLIQRENIETDITYLGITGDYNNPDPDRPVVDIIPSTLTPNLSVGEIDGYSFEDFYNFITYNATTTPANRLETPSDIPASSLYTLTDIYGALITLGVTMSPHVKVGVTYLGYEGSYVYEEPPADYSCGDPTNLSCWSAESSSALIWGPAGELVGATSETNGASNTAMLIAASGSYPAAEYCYNLTEGDVPVGTWYLPALGELRSGYDAFGLTLFTSYNYWSSTEFSPGYAMLIEEPELGPIEIAHQKDITSTIIRCLR